MSKVNYAYPKKRKKGQFGLPEIEKFLKENPGATKEMISQLVSWTVNVLSLKSTVKENIAAKKSVLLGNVSKSREVVTGCETQINSLKSQIAKANNEIKDFDGEISALDGISKLFGY